MDKLISILNFFTSETMVKVVAALWLLEQALRAISELTPWKWDDNLVKVLAKLLKALFPKKKNAGS